MKTRYSSLVSVKRNIMQKSERVVQTANANLLKAKNVLEESLNALNDIATPTSGQITEFLSSRSLLDSQRSLIKHNKEWSTYAKQQLHHAKEQLKVDMIEYEKFNYFDLQEIKEILKKRKIMEDKYLDEVAIITYNKSKIIKEV